MVFHPLFFLGIAKDFGVEDEKSSLKIRQMRAHLVPMRLQQKASVRASDGAPLTQCRIAQHLADRHAGGFQTVQKVDPDQDRPVVVPLARAVAASAGQ